MVVFLGVQDVGREQDDRLLGVVLPPVRDGVDLLGRIAGVVHDRRRARAAVLGDAAGDDVDDRRALAMAVPGDRAAGLDDEPAQAERVVLERGGLLRQVDRSNHGVGGAGVRGGAGLLAVVGHLVGG